MRIPYLETQKRIGCDATGASYRHRTNNYDVLSERIAKFSSGGGFRDPAMCQIGQLQMRFEYFDVFSGLPRK